MLDETNFAYAKKHCKYKKNYCKVKGSPSKVSIITLQNCWSKPKLSALTYSKISLSKRVLVCVLELEMVEGIQNNDDEDLFSDSSEGGEISQIDSGSELDSEDDGDETPRSESKTSSRKVPTVRKSVLFLF